MTEDSQHDKPIKSDDSAVVTQGDIKPDPDSSAKPPPIHEPRQQSDSETAVETARDLTESKLGDFRLLRRIGRGGMAEVYLAEQTSLQRKVAIKILRHEFVSDETHVKRFRTEALAAAGLNHPNIVQVYSIGKHDTVEYIAQEYVQGQNLREFLVRTGPPGLQVALHIMKQVAAALDAAGTAGIVHRDIKPENILITRKGEVKVADFGLARLTQSGEGLNLTQVGVTMGTPLYMSPEQVRGKKVSQQSDIYSFGVTCYHMLSGSPPFRGETAFSVAAQHLQEEPEPLAKLRPDLPPLLCRIVHKMMAKDVKKRYRSAQTILKDLKRIGKDENADAWPGTESTEMPVVRPAEKSDVWPRFVLATLRVPDWSIQRQIGTFLGLALLLFALGVGVGWLTLPGDPRTSQRPVTIPKQLTVAEQYWLAVQRGDQAGFLAVIEHFPRGDKAYPFRMAATQQLAIMYLNDDRMEEAKKQFHHLAVQPESQREYRAFGLAGEAAALSYMGLFQESQELIAQELAPLRHILDETMRGHVAVAEKLNKKHLYDPEPPAEESENGTKQPSG